MECFKYGLGYVLQKEKKIVLSDFLINSEFEEEFENDLFLEIEISEDKAGAFIGERGKNIQNLRKKYDCRILISREYGRRYVYICGKDKYKIFQALWNVKCKKK